MLRFAFIVAIVIFANVNFAHAASQKQYQSYLAMFAADGKIMNAMASHDVYKNADECAAAADTHVGAVEGMVARKNGSLIRYSDYAYKMSDNSGYVMWACMPKRSDSIKYFPKRWEDSIATNWVLVKK